MDENINYSIKSSYMYHLLKKDYIKNDVDYIREKELHKLLLKNQITSGIIKKNVF